MPEYGEYERSQNDEPVLSNRSSNQRPDFSSESKVIYREAVGN